MALDRVSGSAHLSIAVVSLLGVPGDHRHPHRAGGHDTGDQHPSDLAAGCQMRYPGHLKQTQAPIFKQPDPTKDVIL